MNAYQEFAYKNYLARQYKDANFDLVLNGFTATVSGLTIGISTTSLIGNLINHSNELPQYILDGVCGVVCLITGGLAVYNIYNRLLDIKKTDSKLEKLVKDKK